jgi:diaminopimelate decarboxylase
MNSVFRYDQSALCMEEVELAKIAEKAGTPCYVYSARSIVERFRAYDDAFGDSPPRVWAMKVLS